MKSKIEEVIIQWSTLISTALADDSSLTAVDSQNNTPWAGKYNEIISFHIFHFLFLV